MAAADAGQSDVEPKKRFVTVEDDDLKQLLTEKDAKSTRRATDSAVRTFKTYLRERSLNKDFEEITSSELDSTLSKLYAETRTEDGELYNKSSLRSIRYGINRYLANFHSRKDIVHDKVFNEANKVFIAASKDLKRQGKGDITHYPPLELKDLHKLYDYLDSNNNVKLQEKVFLDLMLYFGRRDMMSNLFEEAGLSRRYTNHYLRTTHVHVLDNIGNFASRHIMTVTGHKSENSLKTYTGYTGDAIKKSMSNTISKTLRKSTNETCIQDDQSNIVFELLSDSELHDLITDLNDGGIDDILLALNVKRQTENKENLQLCQSNKSVDILPENVVNKTVNLMDKQYPVPVFNNCSNVTVNFNFK